MFGYLVPDKQELKVKQYALYRASYCGVCRALKLGYGHIARFSVSYDAAVLALLLIGASGTQVHSRVRRCVANPLRPKPVLEGHEALHYVAAVSVLLARGRLQDAWADDRNLLALPAMGSLALAARKAQRRYPVLAQSIAGRVAQLQQLERAGCTQLDVPADVMGNLLSDIMLLGPPQSASAQVLLRSMGYHLGRWVYLVDAIDDLARDEKSASYNVLVAMGGDRNQAVALAVQACEYAAAQAAAIFDLMDMQWAGDIISNLLYGGMPRMLMRVAPNQKQETQYT